MIAHLILKAKTGWGGRARRTCTEMQSMTVFAYMCHTDLAKACSCVDFRPTHYFGNARILRHSTCSLCELKFKKTGRVLLSVDSYM